MSSSREFHVDENFIYFHIKSTPIDEAIRKSMLCQQQRRDSLDINLYISYYTVKSLNSWNSYLNQQILHYLTAWMLECISMQNIYRFLYLAKNRFLWNLPIMLKHWLIRATSIDAFQKLSWWKSQEFGYKWY